LELFFSGDGKAPQYIRARRSSKTLLFGLVSALLAIMFAFQGCSSHLDESPGNFQTRASRTCPPHSVALLPFENLTECPEIAQLVRESLYSHLSPKHYEDVELGEVDARLESAGLSSFEDVRNVEVRELGELLHADAVVYGSVTKCSRVYIGVFSSVCVATSLEVYDTRTGEKVWTDFEEACFHDGGVPLDVLSIPLTAMRSGMNMREVVRVRVVDDLCRTLVARVPAAQEMEFHVKESVGADSFELQVGAFHEEDGAVETAASMHKKGFSAFVRKDEEQGSVWYRVLVGPFSDRNEAESTLARVRESGTQDAFIRRFHIPE
jgi:hypothetical protein